MEPQVESAATISVEIGNDVFHIVGFNGDGAITFQRKINHRL
jgi:hypothetical protein